MKAVRIEVVEWLQMQSQIRLIREAVFIDEQHVPVELEWDGLDEACTQLLALNGRVPGDTALDNREAIGTARMTGDGKIGRMAVLKAWRGQGVGSQLLAAMIVVARHTRLSQVMLDAQVSVIPFYQRFGFKVVSKSFMDAGIEHQKMSMVLD